MVIMQFEFGLQEASHPPWLPSSTMSIPIPKGNEGRKQAALSLLYHLCFNITLVIEVTEITIQDALGKSRHSVVVEYKRGAIDLLLELRLVLLDLAADVSFKLSDTDNVQSTTGFICMDQWRLIYDA